jgi:hypothetical protein
MPWCSAGSRTGCRNKGAALKPTSGKASIASFDQGEGDHRKKAALPFRVVGFREYVALHAVDLEALVPMHCRVLPPP